MRANEVSENTETTDAHMCRCTRGQPHAQQNQAKKTGNKRDHHPKKKTGTSRLFQCLHVYMCTCSKKSQPEAEYIALSMAPRDVIPVMNLTKEIKSKGFSVICTKPHVYCKVFEDNSGALELARLPKLWPRTKHINVCYHHFREHVCKGLIKIFPIDTKDQIADTLTKALAQNSSANLCVESSTSNHQCEGVLCIWNIGYLYILLT